MKNKLAITFDRALRELGYSFPDVKWEFIWIQETTAFFEKRYIRGMQHGSQITRPVTVWPSGGEEHIVTAFIDVMAAIADKLTTFAPKFPRLTFHRPRRRILIRK